ncbi:hypothetical protein NDU88_002278 [Pleurodeles waltl]|uniref:Uncharacterized protein n=1 Tax=Pleurodeles waltl TaxID=8319 RepID=A0AAV7WPE9_PLEWA|nr:hypothetical protein NDU88_002278 [Pleurodeles waltl]
MEAFLDAQTMLTEQGSKILLLEPALMLTTHGGTTCKYTDLEDLEKCLNALEHLDGTDMHVTVLRTSLKCCEEVMDELTREVLEESNQVEEIMRKRNRDPKVTHWEP